MDMWVRVEFSRMHDIQRAMQSMIHAWNQLIVLLNLALYQVSSVDSELRHDIQNLSRKEDLQKFSKIKVALQLFFLCNVIFFFKVRSL